MRLEHLFEDLPVKTFSSFAEWAAAVRQAGGTKTIKSNDQHRIFAVDRTDTPVKHAYGHWDEWKKEGVIYNFRRKLKSAELSLRGA